MKYGSVSCLHPFGVAAFEPKATIKTAGVIHIWRGIVKALALNFFKPFNTLRSKTEKCWKVE
jgi:hypothetical protein